MIFTQTIYITGLGDQCSKDEDCPIGAYCDGPRNDKECICDEKNNFVENKGACECDRGFKPNEDGSLCLGKQFFFFIEKIVVVNIFLSKPLIMSP